MKKTQLFIVFISLFFLLSGCGLLAIGVADDFLFYEDWEDGQLDMESTGFGGDAGGCQYCTARSDGFTGDCSSCGYENDKIKIFNVDNIQYVRVVSDGKGKSLEVTPNCGGTTDVLIKKNIIGDDIKFIISHGGYYDRICRENDVRIYIGDKYIDTSRQSSCVRTTPDYHDTLYEFTTDLENRNIIVVEKNGQFIGEFDIGDTDGMIRIKQSGQANDGKCFSNNFRIKEIKFRPEFSLELESDEILVSELITGSFNIYDLRYNVDDLEKFYDEYPIAKRYIDEGAIRFDESGRTLRRFLSGSTITADSSNEAYIIQYVVKQSATPIRGDCNENQAWYVQGLKCINILQPTAEETDIIIDVLPIEISDNQFTFTHNSNKLGIFFLGDNPKLKFESNKPQILCGEGYPRGYISVAENPQCYEVNINYGGAGFILKPNEEIELQDGIFVKYILSGKGAYSDGVHTFFKSETDWNNLFIFTLRKDLLSINGLVDDIQVKKDSVHQIPFIINNNLHNFIDSKAGVFVEKRKKLVEQNFPLETVNFEVKKGINSKELQLDTSQFGEIEVTITPFIKIIADKEFTFKGDSRVLYKYNIVDKITDTRQQTPNNLVDEETQKLTIFQRILQFIICLFSTKC